MILFTSQLGARDGWCVGTELGNAEGVVVGLLADGEYVGDCVGVLDIGERVG